MIALDAMGGDRAPAEIVAGGLRAAAELDVDILLVGPARRDRRRTFPTAARRPGSRCSPRSKSSRWTTSPRSASARRRTRRSSAAPKRSETARPRRWSARATPAPRWPPRCLRMGRIRGVHRPAIAVPVPVLGQRAHAASSSTGARRSIPSPSGSSQWALLGRAYAAGAPRRRRTDDRAALERRRAGQGRRPAQARRSRCSPSVKGFIGNVEGRDLLRGAADVIVTDGFTGNVALKTARRRDARPRRARVRRASTSPSSHRSADALEAAHCSKPRRRCCPTTPAARCCSA